MTDSSDDAPLRATETQMRNALGLSDNSRSRYPSELPINGSNGPSAHKHRFVRDGEVAVTVIRRDRQPDGEPAVNQLEEARRVSKAAVTARERAERLLEEAQCIIRDLQTKLGHERLAKEEALEAATRAEISKRSVEATLRGLQAELATKPRARTGEEERSKASRRSTRSQADSLQNASLSDSLRSARIRQALSVADVAEQVGVSRVSVYFWETARSRPRNVYLPALCKALKLPIRALREMAAR